MGSKKIFLNLSGLVAVHFLISCQSFPTAPSGSFQKAKWETKAQIKDLRSNKNHSVSIDIAAVKGEKMRLEVSATLGYQVASVVINRQGYRCAVYPEKKFYYGSLSDRGLSEVLNVPVSPRALFSIAFDESSLGNGWSCEKDAENLLTKCLQASAGMTVEWVKRSEGTKLVKITSPKVEMNWFFKSPEVEFEEKEELFSLNPPEGFQVIAPKVKK